MVNWAEYRDMAKHMCPPPGTQIHNPFGAALATTAPQMLTEIFGMFADSDLFSSGTPSDDANAIEKMSNSETKSIISIVKKLNNANDAEKDQYQTQLEDAIKTYYSKHKLGDNAAIDKLTQAQEYCKKNNIS